jgi:hypothetical protein
MTERQITKKINGKTYTAKSILALCNEASKTVGEDYIVTIDGFDFYVTLWASDGFYVYNSAAAVSKFQAYEVRMTSKLTGISFTLINR